VVGASVASVTEDTNAVESAFEAAFEDNAVFVENADDATIDAPAKDSAVQAQSEMFDVDFGDVSGRIEATQPQVDPSTTSNGNEKDSELAFDADWTGFDFS